MHENDEQLYSIVFFLSDHVCSVIEVGDAILNLSYTSSEISPELNAEEILDRLDDFHTFLRQIREYEFLLVTKLVQARHWSLHLRHLDSDFKPIIDLFTTATEMVSNIDYVFDTDDHSVFNGSDEPQQLIESRQLHSERPTGEGKPARLFADENYLLGGKVRLVDLLEVCNSFLDGLEARYGLSDGEQDHKIAGIDKTETHPGGAGEDKPEPLKT